MRASTLTQKRARELRGRMTPPEAALWRLLRQRAAGRPAWRRQHPFGPYILDFFCARLKLAVEIDGDVHLAQGGPEHDARRDLWLRSQGVEVVRVSARDVLADVGGVADRVWSLTWAHTRSVGEM